MTLVLLNSATSEWKVQLDLGGFGAKRALRRQTTKDAPWTTEDVSTEDQSVVTLPSRSMNTIVFTKNDELPE
ncbi:MAG: hypothetical protein QM784_18550 [Polyangiaceae bacterium]